jgi:hypothetical protein
MGESVVIMYAMIFVKLDYFQYLCLSELLNIIYYIVFVTMLPIIIDNNTLNFISNFTNSAFKQFTTNIT